MSNVKVSVRGATNLQTVLTNKYFTKWDERCEVRRFSGYKVEQTDQLVRSISKSFNIDDFDTYNKLQGIKFASEVDVKIYNFCFGDELDKGVVHFGMVAISKSSNTLDAVTSLYTLNFKLGQTRVTRTDTTTFLGIPIESDSSTWYESERLGLVTQRDIINFCKVKALNEFKRQNVLSHINDVRSLDYVG